MRKPLLLLAAFIAAATIASTAAAAPPFAPPIFHGGPPVILGGSFGYNTTTETLGLLFWVPTPPAPTSPVSITPYRIVSGS